MKSNKTHYPTNKKLDSRPFYKDYSSCSLRSYENQCFQDVISDKCSNEQPPKLPHRNYGESTLNMVANVSFREIYHSFFFVNETYFDCQLLGSD